VFHACRGVALVFTHLSRESRSDVRWMAERLAAVLAVSFLVAVLAGSEPSSLVFAGLAALAVAALLAARYAAVIMRALDPGAGERAPQHREQLVGLPEPQHPLTAGRPQTRAPSEATAAA
jgi:hypothetical protein